MNCPKCNSRNVHSELGMDKKGNVCMNCGLIFDEPEKPEMPDFLKDIFGGFR